MLLCLNPCFLTVPKGTSKGLFSPIIAALRLLHFCYLVRGVLVSVYRLLSTLEIRFYPTVAMQTVLLQALALHYGLFFEKFWSLLFKVK